MAGTPKIGSKAPEFCLSDKDEKKVCLKDYKGRWVVLYFYPKDNTSGCTKEAIDFTEHSRTFKKMEADIVGISPDSPKSHEKFIAKNKLKVTLLSDPEHKALDKYGVWQKKKLYGREYFGVVRTTYLIDPKGRIAHIWNKVKVKGHAAHVEEVVKQCRIA